MTVTIVPEKEAILALKCLHGCDEAIVGVFYFEDGCICFKDKIQALCLQHWKKAEQNIDAVPVALINFEGPF